MNKAMVGMLLFVASVGWSCEKGCYVYKDTCACDIQPELAKPVQPSDEKPPADKMPSYQRERVSVVDAPNMAFEDARADQARQDAEAQGKKSAGVK